MSLAWPKEGDITMSPEGHQLVLGQNGRGQNGTDKMAWTKWH